MKRIEGDKFRPDSNDGAFDRAVSVDGGCQPHICKYSGARCSFSLDCCHHLWGWYREQSKSILIAVLLTGSYPDMLWARLYMVWSDKRDHASMHSLIKASLPHSGRSLGIENHGCPLGWWAGCAGLLPLLLPVELWWPWPSIWISSHLTLPWLVIDTGGVGGSQGWVPPGCRVVFWRVYDCISVGHDQVFSSVAAQWG